MANLTKHFTDFEVERSNHAERLGLSNKMPAEVRPLYVQLCEQLEKVRVRVGKPIRISSGYRSPEVNKAAGGSRSSSHLAQVSNRAPDGEAAVDFEVWGLSNLQLAQLIDHADTIGFDQLILEHHYPDEGANSGWVHMSIRPGHNRREKRTAYFDVEAKKTKYPLGLHELERGQVVRDGEVVWPK